MRTEATVIATEETVAIIEIQKKSACDGCHKMADGGCAVCTLLGDNQPMQVRAENLIGAKVGDRVAVESNTARMLWYAVCVFLLPLLFTAVGFGVCRIFTETTWICILGACAGFALTFVGLRIWSGILQKGKCDVVVTQILNSDQ